MRRSPVTEFAVVTSADGTTIGYRHVGDGPGLVLVHGAMLSSGSFSRLAEALSDSFHVYVPDRRGRGRSGPFGPSYGLAREVEDLDALLRRTGTSSVFGLSSGALITLEAARRLPYIDRIAVYEPPFTVPGADPATWVPRYTQEIDRGDLAAGMVTILKDTGDAGLLTNLPRFLLVPLMRMGIRLDNKDDGDVDRARIRDLIPTARYDAQLQREATPLLAEYGQLRCETLIMGGARSHRKLCAVTHRLATLLPHAKRIELPNAGHVAAENGGRPLEVAATLRQFFQRSG